MELRDKIALAIRVADKHPLWTKSEIEELREKPPTIAEMDVADIILALPEIKEGEQLRRLCYLHDGPGGVSVQMREK